VTCPVRLNGVWATAAFSKSEPIKPPLWVPSVSTIPGLINAVDSDLSRTEFASQHSSDGIESAFSSGVDDRIRQRDPADKRADINDDAAFAEMLDCGLGRQKRPKHVDIKHPVECFSVTASIGANS